MSDLLNRKITFDISYGTFAKAVIIAVLLLFLYLIREIVLIMFVAIVISSGVDPWIDFLQKRKIPRWLSVLLIFVLMIVVLGLIFYLLIPPIAEQIQQLVQILPQYFNIILEQIGKNNVLNLGASLQNIDQVIEQLGSKLGRAAFNIFGAFSNILSGFISVIITFVLAFYFVVEEDNLKKFIRTLTPQRHRPYVDDLVDRIQLQVGRWFRGQLLLGAAVGVLVFVGLKIIGVKYALVLALLAGVFEIVPYIGPIVAAVPAVFLGFGQAPYLALLVILVYFVVQQIENNFLVPKVMGKVVGLNPLVIILAILVGGKLAGVLGALLAVPIATALHVFLSDVFETRNQREKAKLQKEVCEIKPHEAGLTEKEIKYREKLKEEICKEVEKNRKS